MRNKYVIDLRKSNFKFSELYLSAFSTIQKKQMVFNL